MNARLWLFLGAVYGFLAVSLGAFGAHALRAQLTAEQMAIYRTGVDYHLGHALALLLVGSLALQRPGRGLNAAGACFAVGIPIFSGSLYLLSITGIRSLGAITPLGGVLFLAGWALLAVWAARSA